jgi:hypothetical protein
MSGHSANSRRDTGSNRIQHRPRWRTRIPRRPRRRNQTVHRPATDPQPRGDLPLRDRIRGNARTCATSIAVRTSSPSRSIDHLDSEERTRAPPPATAHSGALFDTDYRMRRTIELPRQREWIPGAYRGFG